MALKQTPLFETHRELGGRMVPFAGWEMPVQYSSIIEEHGAVRERVGLFDVSHMGEIIVKGPESAGFLDKITCNEVASMEAGQVRYNAVLNKEGGLVDDITIYRVKDDEFFIVSNASNYESVTRHLKDFASSTEAKGVEITDESNDWHLLALQGPFAQEVLEAQSGYALAKMKYYHFEDFSQDGETIRISRTGYTGEDGFEIYSSPAAGLRIWKELLEAGKERGILPAGLGARDILRLEAFYPLYGHELNETWTPPQSGIGFIAKEKEIPYSGYEKIIDHKKNGPPGRVVGIALEGNGIPRDHYPVFDAAGENRLGEILSGAFSPTLKKGIGSAYLAAEHTEKGTRVQVEIRGRMVPAVVHRGPFHRGGAGAVK